LLMRTSGSMYSVSLSDKVTEPAITPITGLERTGLNFQLNTTLMCTGGWRIGQMPVKAQPVKRTNATAPPDNMLISEEGRSCYPQRCAR
jgi:hypothetical protein